MIPIDIEKLKSEASQFLVWWKEELVACIPHDLRRKLEDRARRITIRPGSDRVEIDVVTGVDGRTLKEDVPLEQLDDAAWSQIEELMENSISRISLAGHSVWRTSISLPAAAARNIRPAIELQLPLISPLLPSTIYWGYRIGGRTADRVEVTIILVRKVELERIVGLFDARGLGTPPIEALSQEGTVKLRPGQARLWSQERRQSRLAFMAGLALLATIPVTIWAGSGIALWFGGTRLKALRAEVAPRSAAERRAEIADGRRRAMGPLARQAAIAPVLDDLAGSLPETTYLDMLRFGGRDDISFVLAGQVDSDSGKAIQKASQFLQVSGGNASAETGVPVEFRARVR